MLHDRLVEEGNFCFRYRSYIPLCLVPIFILTMLLFGQDLLIGDSPAEWKWVADSDGLQYNHFLIIIAIIVGFLGEAIRIYVAGYVAKDTSGRNTKAQRAASLNTTGAYSLCRNPLYLGNFLMMLSPLILLGNIFLLIVFTLLFWLYYERIIFAEEKFLSEKFGDEYKEWTLYTPCFIPSFQRYRKPDLEFSLKTVIRKEFNSIFGLVSSLFFVSYIIEMYAKKAFLLIPNMEITWLFCFSLIAYIIIRILVKKTQIFEGAR
ncbi:hypothetical protein CCZ01_00590 [Helicobacter monodelphidis]|uniref:methyltransferase family protein n=1 Tax=Helicobacter sp. 15-1451 TaxID=2004995 RepID=UPI000DCE11D8|nr:isoprenylcysteine carboxylmethyltransferase family protein [Helicobacter sp. 15-1451]RAX59269.1 hypothetical protein CCZ01_00590 [Helicobacter sp. 15-1451]